MNNVLFSTKKDDWETPDDLFDLLNKEYSFTLDVCANDNNRKCDNYFTIDDDCLRQSWNGNVCWMNPPYGRNIYKFVKKAYEESMKNNTTVVCLLPSRTDTKWFHEYCLNAKKITFIEGRLRFKGSNNNAPFPSIIVEF